MFGRFDENFGLPQWPFQGVDPQGGALGVNVSPESDPAAARSQPLPGGPAAPAFGGADPAAGSAVPNPPQALGSPSPLAQGSPLAPASPAQPAEPAPAAGVSSPFGRTA